LTDLNDLLERMRNDDVTIENYSYTIVENTKYEKEQWGYGPVSIYIYGLTGNLISQKTDIEDKRAAKLLIKGLKLKEKED
jgi:hypothetical protein